MKPVLIAFPYANPHLELFFSYVQRQYNCDIYTHGNAARYRKHVIIDQLDLPTIRGRQMLSKYFGGKYDAIFIHSMFHPFSFFLFFGPRRKLIVLNEPLNPERMVGFRRFVKKVVIKLLSFRHEMSLLMLGPVNYGEQYAELAGRAIRYYPYGYYPKIDPLTNIKTNVTQPIHVTFIGQYIDRKNISFMLEAFSLSKAVQNKICKVRMAGNGPLLQQVIDTPCIEHLGLLKHSEILTLLCETDILVLPSKFDGWGAVVNEAAACGCAVLLSENVMSSSLLLVENKTGLFIAKSPSAFAAQLDALCDDPEQISAMKINMTKHYTQIYHEHDLMLGKLLQQIV